MSDPGVIRENTDQGQGTNIIRLERRRRPDRRQSTEEQSSEIRFNRILNQKKNLMVFLIVLVGITLAANFYVTSLF